MGTKKDPFFQKMDALGLALSFDDVRLKSGYSEVMPDAVSLATKFSRHITLNIPVVSAAMDTVTEEAMAIAMAKLGGLGVIHRGMGAKEQAAMVAKVKFHLSGLIETPIVVQDTQSITMILAQREAKGYSFHSFPVVNSVGKLVGVLTENDFDFCEDHTQTAHAVMTTGLVTASPATSLDEAYSIMRQQKKKVLPLIDGEQRLVGMYLLSDVSRVKSGNAATYNVDNRGHLRVAAAIGVDEDAEVRVPLLVASQVDVVVIDTAHGDSKLVVRTLREVKKTYPNLDVVVGNVSEGESAKRLVDAGADGIKVGQGGGSICTTRIVAGIGCPQVTAVYNCSKAIEGSGIPICADGGIHYSGDIPVALGAGADCVMLGRLLAGTLEAPGEELMLRDGTQVKSYRGMGSLGAMEQSEGARQRYGEKGTKDRLVPEGVEGVVPYMGELVKLMHQYLGGLRKGMGYVGAATIQELQEKADFHRISPAGLAESHPHDITITQVAPNYKK